MLLQCILDMLDCLFVTKNNSETKKYNHYSRYNSEGNRFIKNDEL